MTVRGKRNYDITALQRGLRLLHLFSEFPRGLTAKQVAGLSRLPVSTVHRFLANLVSAGFLNRDGEGNPSSRNRMFLDRSGRGGAT